MRHILPCGRDLCEHTTAQHTPSVKPLAASPCRADASWSPPGKLGPIPPGIKAISAGKAGLAVTARRLDVAARLRTRRPVCHTSLIAIPSAIWPCRSTSKMRGFLDGMRRHYVVESCVRALGLATGAGLGRD